MLVEIPGRDNAEGLEVMVVEDVDIVAGFSLEVGVAQGGTYL